MLKLNRNGGVGITSIVIAAMAIGALFWRVDTVEGEQDETEERLDCFEANQKVLDRNQREMAADSAWMLEGVHALLDAAEVARTKRPDVKPSEMKAAD